MAEIEVRMTGDQEASDGVVEFWHGGEQVAFTHYDPHDGHLRVASVDQVVSTEGMRCDRDRVCHSHHAWEGGV
jgi:hypothetical protein